MANNPTRNRYSAILIVLAIAGLVLLLDPWEFTRGESAALTGMATVLYAVSAIGYHADGKRPHAAVAACAALVMAMLTVATLVKN